MWLRGAGTGAWSVCLRPEPTPVYNKSKSKVSSMVRVFCGGGLSLLHNYFNELQGPDVLVPNILDLKQVAHSDCKPMYPSFPGS